MTTHPIGCLDTDFRDTANLSAGFGDSLTRTHRHQILLRRNKLLPDGSGGLDCGCGQAPTFPYKGLTTESYEYQRYQTGAAPFHFTNGGFSRMDTKRARAQSKAESMLSALPSEIEASVVRRHGRAYVLRRQGSSLMNAPSSAQRPLNEN
jgi:hypothetical protein